MILAPKCNSGAEAIQICIDSTCYNQNPFICSGCKKNRCI